MFIKTIRDGEKSGFILSRHVDDSHKLKSIPEEEINFEMIKNNGTSVSMKNPQYSLNKMIDTIEKNFIKIFPLLDSDFQLHLIRNSKDYLIKRNEKVMIKEFSSLITLGDEYEKLGEYMDPKLDKKRLFLNKPEKQITVSMMDKNRENTKCIISIKGWLGTYQSTKGKKQKRSQNSPITTYLFMQIKKWENSIFCHLSGKIVCRKYILLASCMLMRLKIRIYQTWR